MKKYLLSLFVILAFPFITNAASLYLDPPKNEYGPGDTFRLNVRIRPDECINVIEAQVNFPERALRLLDFASGESMVSIWVEKPDKAQIGAINQKGSFSFSGGIPGGYCGKVPGDPGDSDTVASLFFQVLDYDAGTKPATNNAVSFGEQTKVYLNDGLGTEAEIEKQPAEIKLADKPITKADVWQAQISEDQLPPEPFMVELMSSPTDERKFYINFLATDKQTGIDHYEVREERPEENPDFWADEAFYSYWAYRLKTWRQPRAEWRVGEMPYLLKDQKLRSIIKVKAIDKAGNMREVSYIPPAEKRQAESPWINVAIISGIVVLLSVIAAVLWLLIRKIKNKLYPGKVE